MDIWNAYKREEIRDTYGKARLRLKTGNRWHTSASMVMERATELPMGHALLLKYSEAKRYLTAKDITFDMLVTIYDVDNFKAIAARPSELARPSDTARIGEIARKEKMKNMEMRIIGLQDNNKGLEHMADGIKKALNPSLIEVDLFGNETRHIAIDLKTGTSYDLLLNDKIYAPTELINKGNVDDFKKGASQLAFV